MLNISGLRAGYGDVNVLWDIDLNVLEGELVALVGANSSGKTTLLRTISREIPLTSGDLSYQGESLRGLKSHEVAQRGLTQVPEGRYLFTFMTVEENLLLGSYRAAAKPEREENLQRVYDLLPILKGRRKQNAGTLSGGEQQMCALGRAIMSSPSLLLLDEPSIGLAPKITHELFELVRTIHESGITVLLAEQNVKHALGMADKGVVLEQGRIVITGKGQDLVGDERVRKAYLGS